MTTIKMPFACLCAGGTGGHVFPAEALASVLYERGWRLALLTDQRGHSYGGTLGQLQTYPLSGGGVAGHGFFAKVKSLANLGRGWIQARKLLQAQRPDVVIGFGGYASIPGVLAASRLGIPSIIHEQNAVLGRANRLLARGASVIATSYGKVKFIKPEWENKVKMVGTPVRPAVLSLAGQPYQEVGENGKINLLIIGGSQGAQIFSEVIPHALAALPDHLKSRLSIAQQCRSETLADVKEIYANSGLDVTLQSFFEDVPERMIQSQLIITRSGASTMAELTVLGRSALLVPLATAIDNHQMANAQVLASRGGAVLMPQSQFTVTNLRDHLVKLFDNPVSLSQMATTAAQASLPNAAFQLADTVTLLKENS